MKKTLAAILCGALLTGLLSLSALAAALTDGTTNFTLSAPSTGTVPFTQTAYVVDADGRYVTDGSGKFLTEQVTKTAFVVPEGTVVTADGALLADLYCHMADGDYWDVHPYTDILSGAASVTVNCAAQLAALQADGLNADRVIFRVRGTQRAGMTVRGVGTGIYLTCAEEGEPEPEPPAVPVFDDVGEGDWCHAGVTAAAGAGLIAGNGAGGFDPGKTLNWAQAVTFAVRAAQYSAGEAIYGPADQTGEHWYDIYTAYALERGILSAAPADWEAPVTRGEAIVIFVGLLSQGEPVNRLPEGIFPDLAADSPVRAAALAMAEAGMCQGTGGGNFSPDGIFCRREAAVLMARMTGLIAPVQIDS